MEEVNSGDQEAVEGEEEEDDEAAEFFDKVRPAYPFKSKAMPAEPAIEESKESPSAPGIGK